MIFVNHTFRLLSTFKFLITNLNQAAVFDLVHENFDKPMNQPCCVVKQLEKKLFSRFGGEEQHEENRLHLGNAIMSFYSALIDLLGRCAPEMHVSGMAFHTIDLS